MTYLKKIINQIFKISEHKYFPFLFYLSLFLLVFSFNYSVPTDPDLGWHLRYGEEIVNHKNILTKDTFSHTYYGIGVIDSEWPIEAVTYFLYSHWSFLGVSIFFAIFTSLAFLVPVFFFKGSYFFKAILISTALIASASVLSNGARPQNVSWVLFSFLFVFLLKYRETLSRKYLVLIPPLFLIWANSHPSFFLGLLLLAIYISLDIFSAIVKITKFRDRSKWILLFNEQKILIFTGIASLMVTFLRLKEPAQKSFDLIKGLLLPFDFAIDNSASGMVRTSISEWLPPVFFDLSGLVFYLSIILSIAIFLVKKTDRNDYKNIFILLFFIYFSTLSNRNAPYFFFIFIPLMIIITKDYFVSSRLKKFMETLNVLLVLIVLIYSVNKIFSISKTVITIGSSVETYSKVVGYPWEAMEYIKENKLKGSMFNHYNWGGYLVWQLPEYPVFIDGRMPGADIYNEYLQVVNLDESWGKVLKKYEVNFIIFPNNSTFKEKINSTGEWKEVYSDEIAVIFVKTD